MDGAAQGKAVDVVTCTCTFANASSDCTGDCRTCLYDEPIIHARDVTVVSGAKLEAARLAGTWMSIERAARVIREKRKHQ